MHFWIFLISILLLSPSDTLQDPLTAREIIKRAQDKLNGLSSYAHLKMTLQRPTWSRDIYMKSWSKGEDYALVLVTAPARDKGTAFLKRDTELWNWQPTIDRVIKMPPSMMMQPWMGSDFTNDDLVKQSSMVNDYEQEIIGEEMVDGYSCYIIELLPNEEAPVVWDKVIVWIDKEEFMELKIEFYDEDGYLINTMYGKNVKVIGGKVLPSVIEMVPEDEEGHATTIEYLDLVFNRQYEDSFFSVQNMKRVR
jgi:outer membrane lipoprotein-sorting protein